MSAHEQGTTKLIREVNKLCVSKKLNTLYTTLDSIGV